MDQNRTEDYSESGGFPEFSFVSTSDEAHGVIDEYEIRTTSRFSCYVAKKGFGCTDFYDESRKLKVMWEDFQDGNKSLDIKAWRLEYDGVPYLSLSWKKFDCHHGLDRKIPHKEKRRKTVGADGKKRGQVTKKLGCPAKIILREVVKFPEFMISQDTHWYRHEASRKIRSAIKSKTPVGERRIYIYLPKISDHRQHLTGAAGGVTQRLDSRIKLKIQQFNAEGQANIDDIKSLLQNYVENELFVGSQPPPLTSRRFYPTKTDIRNHLYLARNKQEKLSAITPENISTDVTGAIGKGSPVASRSRRSQRKRKLKDVTDSSAITNAISEDPFLLSTGESSTSHVLVTCPDHINEVEISSQEIVDASNSIQEDNSLIESIADGTDHVGPETEHAASISDEHRTTETQSTQGDQVITDTCDESSPEAKQGQELNPVEQHDVVNDSTVIDNLNLITQAMEARMLESSQVLSMDKPEVSSSESTGGQRSTITDRTSTRTSNVNEVRGQCTSLIGRVKSLTELVKDGPVLDTVQNKLLDLVSYMELHVPLSSEQTTPGNEHIQLVCEQTIEDTPQVVNVEAVELVETVNFEIVL